MLKKFCEVTSCNGVVDLYDTRHNKYQFIFWATVMTTMTCATVYFTYATIRGYMNTPSVTNVVTVYENALVLPDVLICYNGGVKISAMLAANFSEELAKVVATSAFAFPPTASVETSEELSNYVATKNLKIKDVYQQFSYACDEMVEMFGSSDPLGLIRNGSRCDEAVPVWTPSGICYVFNNTGHQYYPGSFGGLNIQLKGLPADEPNVLSRRELLHLKITKDYSISMEKSFGQRVSGRSITIPLNAYVSISLNTKRYVRLESCNDCDSRSEVYTSNTCYQNCYQDEMVRSCKCQSIFYVSFERYPDLDICDPYTELHCPMNSNNFLKCQQSCKAKCDEWIFENTISTSLLGSDEYNENSTTVVSIQYDTMQYIKIEEVEAFTMDMAVANVGGQSGLFLGASFITIIQAVYYLALAVWEKFRWKNEKILTLSEKNIGDKRLSS